MSIPVQGTIRRDQPRAKEIKLTQITIPLVKNTTLTVEELKFIKYD